MGDVAIRVDDLSKLYRIGLARTDFGSTISKILRRPRASEITPGNSNSDAFWALKDVSFEVKRGEVVGIIGRNGAGKSTLLKLLSRIIEPTTGRAEIHGRVGSLLEVGTGFHPELTGRDNIYLNGAILGMKRVEIRRKFDEIVAFADIERFLDTPVKRYSSGMYVRLAFAVAAHLEPEVLIVDEVLAVGDGAFQKKCLSKMEEVGQHGRTVLFVSHSMPAITRLCQRAILFEEGRLVREGPSHFVVSSYISSGLGTTSVREWIDPEKAPGGEVARLRAVRVLTEEGEIAEAMDIRRPVTIEMEYEVLKPNYVLMPYHHVYNEHGVFLFSAHDLDPTWRSRPRPAGCWVSTTRIPGNFLAEGVHFVSSGLMTLDPMIPQFYQRDVMVFQVVESLDPDSTRGGWAGPMGGVVRPRLEWRTQFTQDGGRISN
jgi:lipopolysaccharide transport system ATP-binding protein